MSCDHSKVTSIFCGECGDQVNTTPEFEQALLEMKAWRKPKAGDMMMTPLGRCKVEWCSDCRWTGYSIDDPEKRGYMNVPFYESGNWRIFKVISE